MSAPTEEELFNQNVREALTKKPVRDMIWKILDDCGLNSVTFTGDRTGDFLEGRRSIGLDILAMLEQADATIYPRMIIEMHNERDSDSD